MYLTLNYMQCSVDIWSGVHNINDLAMIGLNARAKLSKNGLTLHAIESQVMGVSLLPSHVFQWVFQSWGYVELQLWYNSNTRKKLQFDKSQTSWGLTNEGFINRFIGIFRLLGYHLDYRSLEIAVSLNITHSLCYFNSIKTNKLYEIWFNTILNDLSL